MVVLNTGLQHTVIEGAALHTCEAAGRVACMSYECMGPGCRRRAKERSYVCPCLWGILFSPCVGSRTPCRFDQDHLQQPAEDRCRAAGPCARHGGQRSAKHEQRKRARQMRSLCCRGEAMISAPVIWQSPLLFLLVRPRAFSTRKWPFSCNRPRGGVL